MSGVVWNPRTIRRRAWKTLEQDREEAKQFKSNNVGDFFFFYLTSLSWIQPRKTRTYTNIPWSGKILEKLFYFPGE